MKEQRTLIIDDDVSICKALSRFLNRVGFSTMTADNVKGALDIFQRSQPDIVLLDMNMPDLDGFQTLKRIKSMTPTVRVVVLTGEFNEDLKARCIEAGACGYLEKPFDFDQLLALMAGDN